MAAARKAGLRVYGWVQVGRDESAAREHPEWLHAPQHDEWLEGRGPKGAVVWPWVCVNNRAVFDYELARVDRLVTGVKGLNGLFVCDIQGPPNGCGCGNLLCRSWDNSPGPKVADTPYKHPTVFFSQVFTKAVQDKYPALSVVPILCEECENGLDVGSAHNPDVVSGVCHGIHCSNPCGMEYYPGLLRAMAGSKPVGLMTLYKTLRRDRPEYGGEAAWVGAAVGRVQQYAPEQPVIAVLEGWNTTKAQRDAQVRSATKAGAGYLLAMKEIDQSWKTVAPVRTGGGSESGHGH